MNDIEFSVEKTARKYKNEKEIDVLWRASGIEDEQRGENGAGMLFSLSIFSSVKYAIKVLLHCFGETIFKGIHSYLCVQGEYFNFKHDVDVDMYRT